MKKLLLVPLVLVAVVLILGVVYAYLHQKSVVSVETSTAEESVSLGELTFRYPAPFPGTYISASEWPPVVEIVSSTYSCAVGSVPGADGPLFSIEERVLDGHTFCVAEASEGAAGSTYTTYEYSTLGEKGVVRILFTLRFPQCKNYDDKEQEACLGEQKQFSADDLSTKIYSSIQY